MSLSRVLLVLGLGLRGSFPFALSAAADLEGDFAIGVPERLNGVASSDEAAATREDLSTALAGLVPELRRAASRARLSASWRAAKFPAISIKKRKSQ